MRVREQIGRAQSHYEQGTLKPPVSRLTLNWLAQGAKRSLPYRAQRMRIHDA